jgi:hypothetical protein
MLCGKVFYPFLQTTLYYIGTNDGKHLKMGKAKILFAEVILINSNNLSGYTNLIFCFSVLKKVKTNSFYSI